jgi:Protein of unknown function (DUF3775)
LLAATARRQHRVNGKFKLRQLNGQELAVIQISTAKVAHVILKAREYDAKVAAWDDNSEAGNAAEEPESILEDFDDDLTQGELYTFIAGLNSDEQSSLVALTWVGRGTYTPDQFDDAVAIADEERVNSTATYLMGIPLLSDYLAEGLAQMGISAWASEQELLGFQEDAVAPET